ncbi:Roadkill [Operophtera brumata]|uniref:Roadkill n=1 Tax=Operophtera brumata TaxID=104452 RepID=A0A0L7LBZ1_OPEBR|nr:Roadkill [Operophtera brumata]
MEDNPNKYTIEQEKSTEETYNIKWTVPMFRQLLISGPMASRYLSPRYTVVKVPDTPFQLKVCFYGKSTEFMEIYYMTSTTSEIKSSLTIRWGTAIIHNDSMGYTAQTVPANEWQFSAAVNNLNQLQSKYHYKDNLQLRFEFKVSQVVSDNSHDTPQPHTPQLSEAFGTLLTDTVYSDVTMKSAEGVEFRAHKNVLAVRSEVLRAHFEHNMRESITNVVDTSWETEVLRDVLTFVYTDKAPRVDDAPDKLLAAADYYQLMGLKSLCEEALYKRLTVENAVDTLQLAELHTANTLMQSTLQFIKNGYAELVIKTEGWTKVQSVEFIKKMYEFIMASENNNVDILAAASIGMT